MKKLLKQTWPILRNLARSKEIDNKAYSDFVTMITERNVEDYDVKQQYDVIRTMLQQMSASSQEQTYLFAKRYLNNWRNAQECALQCGYLFLGLVAGWVSTPAFEACVLKYADKNFPVDCVRVLIAVVIILFVALQTLRNFPKDLHTLPLNVHQTVINKALLDFCNEYESHIRESWNNKEK